MRQKILIVEDDPLSAEFMKIYLEEQGYEVRAANSLSKSLADMAEFKPSIVITDIRLGDGSGAESAELFRAQGAKTIIGVSGYSKSQLLEMHEDLRYFDQLLLKPVELSQLAAAVLGR